MSEILWSAVFWFSALTLFYIFIGYPLLIAIWSGLRGKAPDIADSEPDVSILMIVRNEQDCIRNKLMNLLALDYPAEKLQIMIVSDASTDNTDDIIAEFENRGISRRKAILQRGKPASLNECIPELTGDIVILMDARQRVDPAIIHALIRNFNDPHVGAVGGELLIDAASNSTSSAGGVGFYWRYEKFLRRMESSVDSSVGASGALYAIRKRLFFPIAADTLLDDVLIPMNIVRQGYRVIFEPAAIAYDNAASSSRGEFNRKVRTIAGNFQLLSRETWLLNPVANRLWMQTVSHKLLRLTAPLFLITLFLSNILLLDSLFFKATLYAQATFYLAALAGLLSDSRWKTSRIFAIPYAFCLLNWATVVGFLRFVFKQQAVAWK